MKKILASILTLTLCLGLATGCAGKQTPAENDTESAGETGVKEIPSLKIAFSPYADADQITTATEPLEQLLQAKLLEKGYDVKEIDMTVGTSYTAVGEALSAGSADIGFISGGNYVLFSEDCDVLLTALRYAINKDSENPADWNDGTIEEYEHLLSVHYSGRPQRKGTGTAGQGQQRRGADVGRPEQRHMVCPRPHLRIRLYLSLPVASGSLRQGHQRPGTRGAV